MSAAWLIAPLAALAGWLLWTRLPPGDAEREDPLERAFAAMLCGAAATGLLGLTLAAGGWYRPGMLATALAICVAVLWRLPRRRVQAEAVPRAATAAAVSLAVLAGITVAPASEDVLGGRDPGVYANTAVWLAKHGTLRVHSDALASVSSDALSIFRPGIVLPGFYARRPGTGEITPQFLHLLQVYMAAGYWIGGLAGALLVPPLFGALAELSVFFFVRRLLGVWPAVVATVLLALNLAQIWGMRSPYSEGLTQLGTFAALWCAARGLETGGLRWGWLGGAWLGVSFLARIDSLLVLAAIAPAVAFACLYQGQRGRWAARALIPSASLLALWAAVHGWTFSQPYFRDLDHLLYPLWWLTAISVVVSLGALALSGRMGAIAERVHRYGTALWAGVSVALTALFVFGMWVRPRVEYFETVRRGGGRSFDEETLVRIAWYLSVPAMVLGMAGIVVLLRRVLLQRRGDAVPFLTVFLSFSLLYFWKHHISPDHPWAMRRYLPVIVPGICVAVAAAVAWLWRSPSRWRAARRVVAVAALAAIVWHEANVTRPFWRFREKGGVLTQLAAFVHHVPEDSLLLYSFRGSENWAATPLAFEWDRDVLPVVRLARSDADGERRRPRFEDQVLRWLRGGRDVRYLTRDDGQSIFLTQKVGWVHIADLQLRIPTIGSNYTAVPSRPQERVERFRLLRAIDAEREPAPCAGLSLDLGGRVRGMTQGFYGAERGSQGRFRWAMPHARVVFPACDRVPAPPAAVRVRAACGREPAGDNCQVKTFVNGQPASVVQLSRDMSILDVGMPAGVLKDPIGPLEIRFEGPVERSARRRHDSRALSFRVSTISVLGPGGRDR